jgi:glucans biosynthesis protein
LSRAALWCFGARLGHQYGSSLRRGVPIFRSFWLERPRQNAAYIRFWALLDSPSLAGAYQFVLHPGAATTMDIDCSLYTRAKVEKLGLAPLTSMFFSGEAGRPKFVDYRPEVHDSGRPARFAESHRNGGGDLWKIPTSCR